MKLHEIPKDINWARRALTTTSWFALAIILPLTLPVVVPILALYDVIMRRELSATRTMIFFTFFFVLESTGLVIAFWLWIRHLFGLDDDAYDLANRRLQRWWSRGLFWGSVRIFSVDVQIEGLEELEDTRPCIAMSRHASTLDTMMPMAIVRELKRYRYVIKSELLIDPTLDYAAQRIPNVFVNRGGNDPEFEIQKIIALATELEDNAAVVVYPEGTRFTEKKRKRLMEKFEDDPQMYAITESLENTLPPLREGSVRLIEASPHADLVFIAHRGIDRTTGMNDLIKGTLTKARLEVSIWRFIADEVPRQTDAIRDFMVENWQRIDRFVAEGYGAEERHLARTAAAASPAQVSAPGAE